MDIAPRFASRSVRGCGRMLAFCLLLVVLLAAAGPRALFAQTVLQGTITDRTTLAPIAGATVRVLGTGSTTTTDGGGFYSLTDAQVGGVTTGSLAVQATGYFAITSSFVITTLPTTLDLDLLAGGTVLTGVVRDIDTLAPIAGASVLLNSPSLVPGSITIGVTTDGTGTYAFDSSNFLESAATGFSANNLRASATGFLTPMAISIAVNPSFPGVQDLDLIDGSGSVLEGTVTDRTTLAPIAGATVTVLGTGGTTATDGGGFYSLTGAQVGNVTTGSILVQATGYFSLTDPFVITSAPENLDEDLLPGGTVLDGVVTNVGTGLPVVGASVTLNSPSLVPGPTTVATVTDGAGNYAFDSSIFLESAATGFSANNLRATAAGFLTSTAVSVPANPPFPETVNLSLVPGTGIVLQGTLLDQVTLQPIEDTIVTVLGTGGVTMTDANGDYFLTGPQVGNQTTGSVLFQADGYFGRVDPFVITAAPQILDVNLLPGGTVLQGFVRDSVSGDPIDGASVTLNSSSLVPGPTTIGTISASGFYSFDSSNFLESAATGFNVNNLKATKGGYLTPAPLGIAVNPPFPVDQDLTLICVECDVLNLTQGTSHPTIFDAFNLAVDGDQILAPSSQFGDAADITIDYDRKSLELFSQGDIVQPVGGLIILEDACLLAAASGEDITLGGELRAEVGDRMDVECDTITVSSTGLLRAKAASVVDVSAATSAVLGGEVQVDPHAVLSFDCPAQNSGLATVQGGVLSATTVSNDDRLVLYAGTVQAGSVTNNSPNGVLFGYGSIFADVTNDKTATFVLDSEVGGDYTNNDTTTIQSGKLTITGSLTENGTTVGSVTVGGGPILSPLLGGGMGAGLAPAEEPPDLGLTVIGDYNAGAGSSLLMPSAELTVRVGGDFSVAIDSPARFDMSEAMLELVGEGTGSQLLEVLSVDGADQFRIGVLHLGPTGTTAILVDNHDNDGLGQATGEVLYVGNLIIGAGSTLVTNGFRVYYDRLTIEGSVDQVSNLIQTGVFIRGESNGDGGLDIADAVHMLLGLFSGPITNCNDAADVNDDGNTDISDPISLLNYLFQNGPPPPAPFPLPGSDPTPDSLDCKRF